MATELKTKKNDASVSDFLARTAGDRLADCKKVAAIMKRATGAKPKMWGSSIVGFGEYEYRGASGRSGTWMLTGFSPRKAALTLYLMGGFKNQPALMKKLGRFKAGGGCLYLRSLDDVDLKTLEQLITASVKQLKQR
jgi:hypothetical protein